MKIFLRNACAVLLFLAVAGCASTTPEAPRADPLPSWNGGESRTRIVDFVAEVTREGGANYVAPAERIAVFDNDGTLWTEQPLYFQALFAFDRVKAMAPDHPEWSNQEPYASILRGDLKSALAGGDKALVELLMTSHAGMTSTDFDDIVTDWIASARHPATDRHYNEMIYQPMLELLDYLRANGFKTFIVSGGGIEFMRPWAPEAYGIPPEQIVGSSVKTKYEVIDGVPTIMRLPEVNFIDDKEGKPVGIQHHIGQRPIMAVGNSDGDFQMLEWTTAGDGARLGVIIHHNDADREWAYDRGSHIGGLERGLDEAGQRGWLLVNMKNDWNRIYPE